VNSKLKAIASATGVSLFFVLASSAHSAGWTYDSTVDPFTDKKNSFASILTGSGFISFGCFAGEFEGKVSAGEYIGDKNVPDNFRYRVDKNEPVTMTMSPTSKKHLYFNDVNSRFVGDILNGVEQVVIETKNYEFRPSNRTFTLVGAREPIIKVLADCGRTIESPAPM